jgi:hypothetical protein
MTIRVTLLASRCAAGRGKPANHGIHLSCKRQKPLDLARVDKFDYYETVMALLVIGTAERTFVDAVASLLLTTAQAARYLGVDRRTIWHETQSGRLSLLAGRFYYRPDLDDYRAWRRDPNRPRLLRRKLKTAVEA